jgi:acyl carrier protein
MRPPPGTTIPYGADSLFIAEQLCQFARTNLVISGANFDEHSPLAAAGIDSFSLVEVLLFAERTFGVTVPESHWTHENLRTLAALGHCIAELAGYNPRPEPRL